MVVGMEFSMGGVSEPQAVLKARNKIGRPRAPRFSKLPVPQGLVHWARTTSWASKTPEGR